MSFMLVLAAAGIDAIGTAFIANSTHKDGEPWRKAILAGWITATIGLAIAIALIALGVPN
jgi:hypothetical protein